MRVDEMLMDSAAILNKSQMSASPLIMPIVLHHSEERNMRQCCKVDVGWHDKHL